MLYYIKDEGLSPQEKWDNLSTAVRELVSIYHPKVSVFAATEIVRSFITYEKNDPCIAGLQVVRSWCFGFIEKTHSSDDHHACLMIYDTLQHQRPETDQKFAALHLLRMVFRPDLEIKIRDLQAIIRLAQNTGAVTDRMLLDLFNKVKLAAKDTASMFTLYYNNMAMVY